MGHCDSFQSRPEGSPPVDNKPKTNTGIHVLYSDFKFMENMKYDINKENNPGIKRNPTDDV